ncbi:MAG: Ig-like domain-containing protein [Thiomargarita sp.]|nr:Ig-like domain-containing protein [Thiomargarita sp.]
MLNRTLLALIWISILLTGCLGGGGGGGDGGGSYNTGIIEITDDRVFTVTLLVTDNFQPANSQSQIFLTIIARDITNAPLSGVEVSLAGSSDFAVFLTPRGVTGGNGRFTTSVVSNVAETFEVTATAGGKRSKPVEVTFLAPVDLIELSADEEVLSEVDSTKVTVKIHEEFTRERLPEAPFNVTVSGAATLSNVPAITGINGEASFAVSNDRAETVTVTVTSGKLTQTLQLYFGATLSLQPESINALDTATLTALLKDSNNAPIIAQKVQFNFTNQNNETLSPTSTLTREDGTAQVTITDLAKDGGEATVEANSGTLSAQATVRFGELLVDPRISKVTLIVSEDFQPANGRDKITLTVIARDTTNAPLANVPVNLMSESNTAFFETLSGTTEENGRFTTTVSNSIAEAVEVKATAGGVSAEPVTIIFIDSSIDPRVDKIKAIATNDSQRANGRDKITLTVIVRDDQNVPLNVPINLVSSSDFALFDKISGTTGENGRFSTFITSSVPETFEVIARAGGKKAEPVKVTFITTTPVGEIVLSASPNILQTGQSSNITVTILNKIDFDDFFFDRYDRFFYYYYVTDSLYQELLDMDVLLPNTSFNVIASGNAVLHDVPEITNEKAQATFTVTNSHKENVDITVTSGTVTKTLKLYFGASLKLLPHSVNAIETATLTALLKDGNYAPIADQEVTFNFVDDNNEILTPSTATTDIDGTAIVTIRDLENNGGTAEVNVSSGALNAQATVNFLAAFGENRHLDAETTATVLNLNQPATITAHITDHNDLPIQGQQVTFSAKTTDGRESHAKISPQTGRSDEKGEVKTIITNTTGENVIVTVQADSAKQEIPLYFGANISLSPTEAENLADGASPVILTAVVSDKDGVGIVGSPVYFRVITGNSIFLDHFRSKTDELGRTTVSVTSNSVDHAVIEAQVDALTPATSTLTFYASELISSLMLSTDADSLSFNSQEIPIKAVVKDVQGNPVKDGTPVDFMTTLGIITESVLTNNGIAEANFSPKMQSGLATITATAGNVTDSLTLEVQPGDAGTIEVSKIEPKVIGVIGSGVVQIATIEFLVKDSLGNIVADGTDVKFSLGKTTLGGGETITTKGDMGKTADGTTNNGLVSVTLKGGTVAGNIDVIATINDTISTIARVTIVGSVPDADHLSLAAEYLNIAGGVTFGLFDEIVAYVGDRFGNIVPDGTSVSFITEGGMIGKSIGGGAFTTSTEFGQATAILQSAEPTTPFLGGVPAVETAGYGCSSDWRNVQNPLSGMLLCGNPGFATIVAYTTGSESFVDENGNGIYDQGEPFDDLSEPYIDGNENDIFEAEGELYVDVNGNGQFDNGNGEFDGPGGTFKNTTIWTDIRILFSAEISEGITVTPPSFSILNADKEKFTVSGIGDIYGNGLVEGTKVQVTTNNGVLGGQTDFTFTRNELGLQSIEFTLSSNPPKDITEKDKDGNEHTRQEYPLPNSAIITITITSKDTGAGGNGNMMLTALGQINVVE